MVFIFGGAYQGKLDYAKAHYDIHTVCDCSDGHEPDLTCDAICGISGFVMECVRTGGDARDFFAEHEEELAGKVLIGTDVSCGIVPIDPEERAFREMNGRVNSYLARSADEVVQVFCGLGKTMTKQDSVI